MSELIGTLPCCHSFLSRARTMLGSCHRGGGGKEKGEGGVSIVVILQGLIRIVIISFFPTGRLDGGDGHFWEPHTDTQEIRSCLVLLACSPKDSLINWLCTVCCTCTVHLLCLMTLHACIDYRHSYYDSYTIGSRLSWFSWFRRMGNSSMSVHCTWSWHM